MLWTATESYCSSVGPGYRLPTLRELASLMDLTVTSGAKIDPTAFPDTPKDTFWTSSPCSPSLPDQKRTLDFTWGYSGWSDGTRVSYRVRCVR
jgi:hypothetical protein